MSLYDDEDTERRGGAATVGAGWSSGIRLLQSQLKLKKAATTTQPKREIRKPVQVETLVIFKFVDPHDVEFCYYSFRFYRQLLILRVNETTKKAALQFRAQRSRFTANRRRRFKPLLFQTPTNTIGTSSANMILCGLTTTGR